jgi:THO complex subunit 2
VRRGPPRDDRQLREERSRDVLREDPRDNDRGGRTDRRALPEPSREPPRDLQPRPEPQQDLAPRGPRRGGRLEMGPPQSESTYGRLNAPAEPPSGPKHGPVNQRRNFTAPQSATPSAPSPTTSRPPDSHTSFRGSSRQSMDAMGQGDRLTAPNSGSSTPANENGPAMHPSRAAAFAHPAPIQTNLPAPNGPRNNGGSPVHPPPSGPRGPGRGGPPSGTPTGPSPSNSSFPPSGPASADERQRRGDRQRANINATLQQGSNNVAGSNGQGVNFRGASSRQTSVSGPSAPSGPAGYRGQRREDDRGEIGPPPGNMDGRKRRHEDAQFEGVKRRRSAR